MTSPVPADQIETLVGARRHPTEHIIRGRSDDGMAYILHPDQCRDMYADLRDCPWSLALDRETYLPPDVPLTVRLRRGRLDASGPVPDGYRLKAGS